MSVRARTAKGVMPPWRPRWSLAAVCRKLSRGFRKVPGLNEGFVIKD